MRRSAGFTLIEVLAVVLLTGLVLGIALDFYVDLSRASNRAADHTRGVRRATAILDRMARDFESAVLVRKPDAVDPLAHPWVFLAESEYSSTGADHIKFMTRNHRPRSTAAHESDLAVVSYTVRRTDDDQLELLRWSSPQLPEGLDRDFPYDSEDGPALLADGIAAFGVTLIDEAGGRSDRWDSSQLVESSELPIAVEIEVAMATDDGSEPVPYRRYVLLPVRPLDLVALLDPQGTAGGGGADDEEDGEDGDGPVGGSRDEGSLESGSTAAGNVPTVGECPLGGAGLVANEEMSAFLQRHSSRPITDFREQILSTPMLQRMIRPECLAALR
jgi:prepilin-type N-terminal cleavage/methylation domain-containing protein